MQEVKSNSSFNLNTSKQRKSSKPAFMAETPAIKARKSAIKFMNIAAGRYVKINFDIYSETSESSVTGLLTCVAGNERAAYYVIMDADRNTRLIPVEEKVNIIKDEIPMSLSVLDYLKWHETDFLVDRVQEFLTKENTPSLTPITINWHKQFGKQTKNDNKKTAHNKNSKTKKVS